MNLAGEQARVHAALGGGFLKVDRSDEALWLSDLPRRMKETQRVEEKLRELGVRCIKDEKSQLWHLDWTEERWEEVLSDLPACCPSLPEDESLHAAYAFCRFALGHPSPHTPEGMKMVRSLLKGTAEIGQMHEKAVELQRKGQPSAYDAGRVLAAILIKQEEER